MAGGQRNNLPVLQKFHHWIRDSTVSCKPVSDDGTLASTQFIPLAAVKSKLQDDEDDYSFVRELRDEVLQTQRNTVAPQEIARTCSRVFCILLILNQGKWIAEFVHHDSLHDSRLPFDQCPEEFPIVYEGFFEEFRAKQWEFCALEMWNTNDLVFKDERILPFTRRERISEGGSATIDKVYIHRDYDKLLRRTEEGMIPSPNHCFALKTYYGPQAESYYNREVTAFRRLLEHNTSYPSPSMIGFFGSYKHQGTFNVILEYADGGTLEDFFRNEVPPRAGYDIIAFWSSLFEVLKALFRLHEQSTSEHDPQCRTILQGWHQDIKPQNILIAKNNQGSPYEWNFKLADLGLSHFKAVSSGPADSTDLDTFGTRTYGAPECYSWSEFTERRRSLIKRYTDIWSFGCVCSEAVVWVVYGYKGNDGLEDYRMQRLRDSDKIQGFRGGNCFHNGCEVRESVRKLHDRIRSDIRRADHITGIVLDEIIDKMLRKQPETRLHGQMMIFEAEQAIEKAKGFLTRSNTIVSTPTGPVPSPDSWHSPSERSQYPRQAGVDRLSDASQKSAPAAVFSDELMSSPRTTVINEEEYRANTHGSNMSRTLHDRQKRTSPPPRPKQSQYDEANQGSPMQRRNTEKARQNTKKVSMSDNTYGNDYGESRNNPRKERSVHYQAPFPEPGMYAKPSASTPVHHGRGQSVQSTESGESYQVDSRGASPQDENIVNRDAAYARELQASFDAMEVGPSTNPEPSNKPMLSDRKQTQQDTGSNIANTAANHTSGKLIYREPPPELSVAEAINWRQKRRSELLKNEKYRSYLQDRDHLFLVDDSASMKPHWKEAATLLDPLAYMTKDADPDGVELFFMTDRRSKKSTHSSVLVNFLHTVEPQGTVDARVRLGEILHRYQGDISANTPSKPTSSFSKLFKTRTQRQAQAMMRLSIYVLTTGQWQPGCELDSMITGLVNKIKASNVGPAPIGIQFIRFGNDPEGIARLKHLDDELGLDMDIIDTEPSNGNVWKMLLGAINAWFDNST